jgi:hypothetical protein
MSVAEVTAKGVSQKKKRRRIRTIGLTILGL